ncbi:MAG: GIY-YIG nuclease family protein [Candidatus Thermoplasmatota archaeon]|nr:GIY-YIG nuclease family protein [Candidatus Thermoplasmatota archaeon]MBU1862197.1 GIY-YIG nuclease family protein [Candidatus Omnitrophota bacterium]
MPYNVYVIELDKEVLLSKKFREKNPRMKTRLACYYVGQTSHDPETRFEQHKAGYKANRFVKRYGMRLVPRKFRKYNPIEKREDAEILEQWLARKLRKKGHGVWSN